MDRRRTFVAVTVYLTPAEYDRLRHDAAFTGEGTVRASIRGKAHLQETPVGWQRRASRPAEYQLLEERDYLEVK